MSRRKKKHADTRKGTMSLYVSDPRGGTMVMFRLRNQTLQEFHDLINDWKQQFREQGEMSAYRGAAWITYEEK